MRNWIIYCSLLFVFSCTDRGSKEKLERYTIRINNTSNENLIIKGYTPQNALEFEYAINAMSVGGETEYVSYGFNGYQNYSDSIIVTFPNSKGYICDVRPSEHNYCFLDRNLLDSIKSYFNHISGNSYEFIITQEDYENAHDLP